MKREPFACPNDGGDFLYFLDVGYQCKICGAWWDGKHPIKVAMDPQRSAHEFSRACIEDDLSALFGKLSDAKRFDARDPLVQVWMIRALEKRINNQSLPLTGIDALERNLLSMALIEIALGILSQKYPPLDLASDPIPDPAPPSR